MLIELNGTLLNKLPIQNIEWIRDLLYYEGPLLSEYKSSSNEIYLKYWCDCSEIYNRWYFVKVREKDKLRLVLGELSLFEVFTNQPDDFVFFIDQNQEREQVKMVFIDAIPEEYLPETDAYLEIEDYVGEKKYNSYNF